MDAYKGEGRVSTSSSGAEHKYDPRLWRSFSDWMPCRQKEKGRSPLFYKLELAYGPALGECIRLERHWTRRGSMEIVGTNQIKATIKTFGHTVLAKGSN
jgi:hypothetical protein